MIKNTNEILTQNLIKVEGILRNFVKDAIEKEQEGQLTINSMEKIVGTTIAAVIQVILGMAGAMLSNIAASTVQEYCSCGKRLIKVKKNSQTNILSMFGHIPVTRDIVHCRRCHKGYGVIDKLIEIDDKHRITKAMVEVITYVAQMTSSFERASEVLKKLLKVEVSPTQIQIVSEEVGKKIFEKEMEKARQAYEKPEIAAPELPPAKRKDGKLYIFTDGMQINTRIEQNGTTWREMKLGLVFTDKDVIKRGEDKIKIVKKEYVSYFGSVTEFKKAIFAAAARAGYGKLKEVVVIADGAQWIWNMCDELFPDAVKILDYYHLSENVHQYAKILYSEDEINRKRWIKEVLDKVNNDEIEEAIKIVNKVKIKKLPDNVVNLPTYMENNRERISYKTFKEKGYYIGSGAIESGNKMVIGQRMKQAGMRWSINGGQYIATLRAKYESHKWDDVVKVVNE
ncbi:MAG: hypothetical protein PWQ70_937 [Clostridiales bacterium]|jgi:hypothetical protein|nr:hypothetical protein [Clostridiales bacterium]